MNEAKTYKLVEVARMMENAHTLYHKALHANVGKESLWQEVENEYANMFKFVQTYIPMLEAEFITQNSKIKSEHDNLHKKFTALQQKLEQCSQHNSRLFQENPRLQDRNEHLQKENERLKTHAETLTQENNHLKEENERLEMQVKRQTQDLAQSKTQLKNAMARLEELQAGFDGCDQEQRACYTEKQVLERQLQQCKQEGTIEQQEPQNDSNNSEELSVWSNQPTTTGTEVNNKISTRPRPQNGYKLQRGMPASHV